MMKVQVQHLINVIGQADYADLIEYGAADTAAFGLIVLVEESADHFAVRGGNYMFRIAIEHGIAEPTIAFEAGQGEAAVTAYRINAGMLFVQTNADGDIWTKDGYVLTESDIKLLRRTYERQLPTQYANDKGLYVW